MRKRRTIPPRRSEIAELEELLATLKETVRQLSPGRERQAALKKLGAFQMKIDALRKHWNV